MEKHSESFQIESMIKGSGAHSEMVTSSLREILNILEKKEASLKIVKAQMTFFLERYTLHRIGNENSDLFEFMRNNRQTLEEVNNHYSEVINLINRIRGLLAESEKTDKVLETEYHSYQNGEYSGDDEINLKAEGPNGKL